MTRILALTLAALLGTAATVAAFTPVPDAHRPAVKTSLNYYGSNYGVMDGDDQYYRGTDRYGRAGYGGGGGSGYGGDYGGGYGGYRTERLSDVGKVSSSRDVMWHIHTIMMACNMTAHLPSVVGVCGMGKNKFLFASSTAL